MNPFETEGQQGFQLIDNWSPELLKKAALIYEQGLGQKYISEEDLNSFVQNKDRYVLIGIMADNELAGVMLAYSMTSIEAETYDRELLENKVPAILKGRKVGIIKSVAVDKRYRRRGIGTALITESMYRLKEKGCDLFFAVSWKSGLRDSSPSIFSSLGFTNAFEFPQYWYKDSIKEGYNCPVDQNPCRCPAIFFFKNA